MSLRPPGLHSKTLSQKLKRFYFFIFFELQVLAMGEEREASSSLNFSDIPLGAPSERERHIPQIS
jgi:hypothetical protein